MIVAPASILDYWFGAQGSATEVAQRQSQLWFGKQPEKDLDISERFTPTLNAAIAGALDSWAGSPRGLLALVIVLDQFPHHIYRNRPQAFAQDVKSLALCMAALASGEDKQLTPIERVFLYLPLEHSESLAMQDLSVVQYQQLASTAMESDRVPFENFLDYAHKHREVVLKYGRFPHRNDILGRPSSPAEIAFLKQPGSRF